jgi:hypothetical protein
VIYGLVVQAPDGPGAVLVVEIGWTQPPPVGATWSCCRRGDIPAARVVGHDWAGLDGEPGVWVAMEGDRRLVGHLVDRHGFGPVRP